jgi:hypothetical protein
MNIYQGLQQKHSILSHPIILIVDNEDLNLVHVTNDNEEVIEHLNVMVIEEENVLHDLNLEIMPQLMVNNSII